ncbi:MAG: tRNA (N(6)-L-threonylcarbamoyladenosine(37)-C(2))-methylthiotransferase MtaB [Trichlorobacter sp.]|jgi:threonylcarbamoyladenosine tRNA methylthiotransferase MtaB
MTRRVAIATLGCKVNQFETADMAEQFRECGWELVPFTTQADLYLINSCTVTARSDAESRRLVRRARRTNPQARVVATGCYAQVQPEALAALAELDQVLGNEEKREIVAAIARGTHQVTDLSRLKQAGPLRLTSHLEHTRAFLQVQNGCENGCSYCIVPSARGPNRSVPPDEVVTSVQRLTAGGYQEVVLTGIHLGAYGLDLTPPNSLTGLIDRLEDDTRNPRLRLGSIEPNELTDDLLARFAKSGRLCHHLHIPLQSGCDTVLERMKRRYTAAFYQDLLERAAVALPDAFIAADLIAGFPGESKAEHEATCRLVELLPLADLHVFPYSRRPGTPAAEMPDQVPPQIITKRAEQLRCLAADKRMVFQQRFIGGTLDVLGQRHDAKQGMVTGLSRNYLEVQYPGGEELVNREVTVLVTGIEQGILMGRCNL